jgi:hypothetical protein
MAENQERWHDDYRVVRSVEPFEVAVEASDVEPIRAMVASKFFSVAKSSTRRLDEFGDKTVGCISGGRLAGDDDAPRVFAGASLEHFSNMWRLVILRTTTHDSALSRVAVRYFLESDGQNVFEAKSQARVMRGTKDIIIDEEFIEEEVRYSRLEYEKPLDKVACLRLQRQLARAVARLEILSSVEIA